MHAGLTLRTLAMSALAMMIAVPSASAAVADLTADQVYTQAVDQAGPAAMVWVLGNANADPRLFDLELRAAEITGTEYEKSSAYGPSTPAVQDIPSFRTDAPPHDNNERPIAGVDVQASLADAQERFRFSVRPIDSDVPVELTASLSNMASSSVKDPHFAPGAGFSSAASSEAANPGYFTSLQVPGSWLLSKASSAGLQLEISGDFVLEMERIDIQIGDDTVRSTESREAWADGTEETTDFTGILTQRFVRLTLTDATLTIAHPQVSGQIQWLLGQADLQPDGPITFTSPRGLLAGQEIDQERATMEDVRDVRLVPVEDGIHARVGSDASTQGSAVHVTAPGSFWLPLGLALAFFLLAAGGAFYAVRLRPVPDIRTVEAAIAAGDFSVAARDAGRILRRRPDDEAAAVARSIALSKDGHHDVVVAESERRLHQHKPTDGIQHYLLGCAYLETGAVGRAKRVLREAGRLTPSLQPEIESLVGAVRPAPKPASTSTPSSPPTKPDFGGYA